MTSPSVVDVHVHSRNEGQGHGRPDWPPTSDIAKHPHSIFDPLSDSLGRAVEVHIKGSEMHQTISSRETRRLIKILNSSCWYSPCCTRLLHSKVQLALALGPADGIFFHHTNRRRRHAPDISGRISSYGGATSILCIFNVYPSSAIF